MNRTARFPNSDLCRTSTRRAVFVLAAAGVVLAACGGEVQTGDVDAVRQRAQTTNALTTTNALSSNALSSNAITTNAITTNAITTNALSSNALSSNALSSNGLPPASTATGGAGRAAPVLAGGALEDPARGESLAMLIKYSVRCMLRPDQLVVVQYRNPAGEPVRETFAGNLGLQSRWVDEPLDASDRLWWAACLGAHVNDNGPVTISVRSDGHPALATTPDEEDAFPTQEGAIWATYDPAASHPMHFYTCSGSSYDPSMTTRHCLAEDGKCGSMFTYIGPCSGVNAACAVESDAGNLDACFTPDAAAPSRRVITVFLE